MQENTTITTASTPTAPATDRLELVESLSRGSIGQVHKARSSRTDRVTALRQFEIPQWLDDVNELMQKILAEARTASGLEHPNIARLYTCGYKDFNVFMTADFVEGKTLQEVMAIRTPELVEVLDVARQLLVALDYAHEKGAFHHFLNPCNIKVLPNGTVKILDFGLLREKNLLTQTPAKKLESQPYLSPEQVNNRTPNRAANLFSAATILYELFTTRSPFAGKHLGEVDRSITDASPHPLHVANGRVPEVISRVVLKGLSKNPADRYHSGAQMLAALEAAMKEPRVAAPANNRPATGKFPAMETGSFNVTPATGKFTAMDSGSYAAKPATGKSTAMETGSFNTGWSARPPAKLAVAPSTTVVRVPARVATTKRTAAGPVNQGKLVAGVVASLVVLAALAMMLQRKPTDLPTGAEAAQASPTKAAQAPPFRPQPKEETSTAVLSEPQATPARSRRMARVPQIVTAPAPTAPSKGQLSVGSLPIGATVEIEGQSGTWQTPQTVGPLAPGTYKVTISKPGYSSQTRVVQVGAGGRTPLDVKLSATKGWITVTGSPAGAAILVDGRETGKVTPANLMLDPATHNIALHKKGYLEASTDIRLAAGQAVSYSPSLMAAGRTDDIRILGGGMGKLFGGNAENGMARIEIKSEPKGAQVVINGTPLQKTTPVEIQVDAGSYDITLQKEGFKAAHESAIVGVADRVKIDKALMR